MDRLGLGPESATRRFFWPNDDGSPRHYRRFPWTPVPEKRIEWRLGLLGFIVLAAGAALLFTLDSAPGDGALGIIDFELAGSGERVEAMARGDLPETQVFSEFEAWDTGDVDLIRRQLLFDFVFAAGYGLFLAFLCGHGRRHVPDRWAIALGRHAGRAALAAAFLDWLENGFLLVALDGLDVRGAVTITELGGAAAVLAAVSAWAKFALLGLVLVFLVMAALAWIWGAIEFKLGLWMLQRGPGKRRSGRQERKATERLQETDMESRHIRERKEFHRAHIEELDFELAESRSDRDVAETALKLAEVNLKAAEARALSAGPAPADIATSDPIRAAVEYPRVRSSAKEVQTARARVAAAQKEVSRCKSALEGTEARLRSVEKRRQRLAAKAARLASWPRSEGAPTPGSESDAQALKTLRAWYIDGLQTRAVPDSFADGRHAAADGWGGTKEGDDSWDYASAELREYWQRRPVPGRFGISASGGGIRSASFHLGVYQALQEEELLTKARYVASVSGGGYITGALTALRYETEPGLTADQPPFAPRSPEERLLRNNTSYLAPGAWQKFTAVLRFLGGFVHNAMFMTLAVWVVVVPLAALSRSRVLHPFLDRDGYDVWWSWPVISVGLVALLLAGLAVPSGMLGRLPQLRDREAGESFRAVTAAIGIGLIASAVLIPVAVTSAPEFFASVVDWLPIEDLAVDDTTAEADGDSEVTLLGMLKLLGVFSVVANAAGALVTRNKAVLLNVGGFFLLPAGVGAAAWYGATSEWGSSLQVWLFAVFLLVTAFLPGDQTRRTFHPFYKKRLESVFAVRRTASEAGPVAKNLDPDTFWSLSRYRKPSEGSWPQTIFCAAANITSADMTPPGRDAVAFTFSSTEIGGPGVGYVETRHFENVVSSRLHRNATLPAAVAISGAALAPSMGKSTRPAFTSLLALLNVRLGVWTPHPDSVARVPADMHGAWSRRPRAKYFLREVIRKHRHDDEFLYVTDGGHLDNLGLVELLRRGCTVVLAFDASGDDVDRFTQIGQAIALARSELGVEIVIDPEQMRPDDPENPRRSPRAFVSGSLHYPDGTTGVIVFAKTAVVDGAPWDVRAFGLEDENFPAHSTVRQLFDDQKFESYRTLGYLTGASAAKELRRVAGRRHIDIEYVD